MNERTTLIAQAFVGGAAVASLVALMLSGKKKRTVLLDDRNKPGGAGFVYNKAHIYDGIAHVSGQVAVQIPLMAGRGMTPLMVGQVVIRFLLALMPLA